MSEANPHDRKRSLALGLAAAGVLASLYLELLHVQIYLGLGHTSFCEAGEHLSCASVALSSASVVLGMPMPVYGVAGFLALGNAALFRSRLFLPLAAFASVSSVGLLVYEIVAIGSICMFCEVVHVLCFGLLAVAWLDRGGRKEPSGVGTLASVLGLPAVLLGAVWLFAPAYWNAATWTTGTKLPHGVDEEGRHWIGAEEPDLIIHEFIDYLCPHCKIASARMKMRLADDPGLRIVRRHQPRMHCGKEPTKAQRCFHLRAVMCAGEQEKFWEMDDWLFHHAGTKPKFDLEPAALAVGLDLDELTSCMAATEGYMRGQAEVDAARDLGIRGTPGYAIDGKRVDLPELREILNAR